MVFAVPMLADVRIEHARERCQFSPRRVQGGVVLPSMKLRLIVPLLFLGLVSGFAQSAPPRIAVIDVNEVLSESNAGKVILGRLKVVQEQRAAQAGKLNVELNHLEQELGVNRLAWSEARIAEQTRLLKDKQAALERFTKNAEQELGEMRDRELQKLDAKIHPVIEAVAAEKNLDAVFNKYESGLLFASDRIDITHDVITRFNAVK